MPNISCIYIQNICWHLTNKTMLWGQYALYGFGAQVNLVYGSESEEHKKF